MNWPFTHLKQTSSWPMQPFTLQLAAVVLQAPEDLRLKAANKMIERCVRMGARLAMEFGMPAPIFVEIAKAMIIKEGGLPAKIALAEAFGEDVLKIVDNEEALDGVQAQVAEIFGAGDDPEA